MAIALYDEVNGVARKVTKKYDGVAGVARSVKKCYDGVAGVARQYFSSGKPAVEFNVGESVFLNIDGADCEFLVVHQGNPDSTIYDASCDGTWLMLKDLIHSTSFSSSNVYANTSIHKTYLNITFYNMLDAEVQAAIKEVKIPYTNGNGSTGTDAMGSDGLTTKVFLPSAHELGSSDYLARPATSVPLSYFSGGTNATRKAYKDGVASYYWTRSPERNSTNRAFAVSSTGGLPSQSSSISASLRPMFIVDPSFLIRT